MNDNNNMKGKDLSDINFVDVALFILVITLFMLQLYKMGVLDQIKQKLNPPQEQSVNVAK